MKLLFLLHLYVPIHNAGGETTAHAAMRAMVNRGHEVHVICRPHDAEQRFEPYEYEGVKVVRPPEAEHLQHEWFVNYAQKFNPDVLLTHLDLTFNAEQLAVDVDKPLAHFVHNERRPGFHRVSRNRCQLAIYNSNWVARNFAYKAVPSVTVHPVIEPDKYKCKPGTKITLVNPTPGKGEGTFYGLSRLMPEREFLVVKSVYGEQVFPPSINASNFPNVEFMEHTSDIREVFQKTRVILMPSLYESYGRVAVEAACAGIPSIVHPTEGLLEALGAELPPWIINYTREKIADERTPTPRELKGGWVSGAGIFCDRDDLESWQAQINRLLTNEIYYRSRVDAAAKLVASLTPEDDYDRLEDALLVTSQGIQEEPFVKKWISDRRIWETSDGLVAEVDGRIPKNATRLAVGIGGELPEEVAIANGLIAKPEATEAKAIEAPAENKAVLSPQATKGRKKKTA